ncbi:hypothetical protein EKO23_09520 [Nocardioides guangzhouensis]|uniref:MFS transporter n=1 Tax=Nocardioides guangzhouensis TaxID=2497878 RepID=A0A4Q4ZFP4_9ACTN|nr:hypothetical protein [Nocardioides guangzhouensis]RYP86525.1 hypothetical protein EKO23_09520 [Nocardioides guangzhouensis]
MFGMFHALRDVPFVALTAVSAVLSIHYWIVDLAMPLWLVEHTEAPKAMVAMLVVLNCAAVVLGQVAVARRVDSMLAASRATVVAGFLTGWWLLGGILLAASLLFVPALRWAERTRTRYHVRVPADSLAD